RTRDRGRATSGMGFDRKGCVLAAHYTVDDRGVIEGGENALGPILKKESAFAVVFVVASDVSREHRVVYRRAPDEPVAAAVERKPAIYRGYIGPSGHSPENVFVHR